MNFYLSKIKSKQDLKRLFIEQWNWDSPSISGNVLAEKINTGELFLTKIRTANFDCRVSRGIAEKNITLENIEKVAKALGLKLSIFFSDF